MEQPVYWENIISLLGIGTGQPVLRHIEGQQPASGQKTTVGQEHAKELSGRVKLKNVDHQKKKLVS